MIGDLILLIKYFFKQTFCIHDYKKELKECGMEQREIYTCKKCGRIICK